MPHCDSCPVRSTTTAAEPAVVECIDDQSWTLASRGEAVHLVALFRDPGIQDRRSIPTVLDLRLDDKGHLRAGRNCWVGPMLRSLGALPRGLHVALDNGVRCPCPKKDCDYHERVTHCLSATRSWLEKLRHPDGGYPGVLVCDKDLAHALASLGQLTNGDGSVWHIPSPFVAAIGQSVHCFCRPALICPHPAVVSRSARYRVHMNEIGLASAIRTLARL
jgi:hypothetical protein